MLFYDKFDDKFDDIEKITVVTNFNVEYDFRGYMKVILILYRKRIIGV